jgi:hypothetical protein
MNLVYWLISFMKENPCHLDYHLLNFNHHNYELHHRPIIGFNHHQSNHYLSNSSNFISPISKELTVLTPVVQNKVDVLNVLQPVENEVFKNKIFVKYF